jgi:hypothetical protein
VGLYSWVNYLCLLHFARLDPDRPSIVILSEVLLIDHPIANAQPRNHRGEPPWGVELLGKFPLRTDLGEHCPEGSKTLAVRYYVQTFSILPNQIL